MKPARSTIYLASCSSFQQLVVFAPEQWFDPDKVDTLFVCFRARFCMLFVRVFVFLTD